MKINFLKIHPRTALWQQERKQCEVCTHCDKRNVKSGDASVTVLRCLQLPGWGAAVKGYCIDMRDEGMPCGPNATLFQPQEKSK